MAVFTFGPFSLDPRERTLARDGQLVALTGRPFDTLVVLVERAGTLLTKDELMRAVWAEVAVEENNLTQAISTIRRALGHAGEAGGYLETVPRRGYRFRANVTVAEGAALRLERTTLTKVVLEEEETETVTDGPPGVRPRALVIGLLATTVAIVAAVAVAKLVQPSRTVVPAGQRTAAAAGTGVGTAMLAPLALAVLPFEDLASPGSPSPLGAGLADAVVTRLTPLAGLAVRPISATLRYSRAASTPVEVGRSEAASHVLDARVQREGARLRITAQLLRVADGSAVWSAQFDEVSTDLFAMQDRLARRVAEAMVPALTAGIPRRAGPSVPASSTVYESYLLGRFYWNQRSTDGFNRAIEEFQRSLALQPDFAPAIAGLALVRTLGGGDGSLPSGNAYAKRALALDDTLAEAHTALAYSGEAETWNFAAAEQSFAKALGLDPGYPTAWHWYAYHLAALGRMDQALDAIRRAEALDPRSIIISVDVGHMLYLSRRFAEAELRYRRVLAEHPDFVMATVHLAEVMAVSGKPRQALVLFEQVHAADRIDAVALEIYLLARAGDLGRAQAIAEGRVNHYNHSFDLVMLALGRGDPVAALGPLARGLERHEPPLLLVKSDPIFDPLRSQVQFEALLRSVNLK